MEKFNFLRFAKISCLVLGLSSLALSSCSDDTDDPSDPSLPKFPVMEKNGFHVVYPEKNPFLGKDWNEVSIKVGDHTDKFQTYFTWDSTSNNVRITYYSLVEPATVEASDVDALTKIFKNDVYCEDNGYNLISEETVSFAGCDANKLTAMQVWYFDNDYNKIDCQIYKERYTFYNITNKKVYSVVMEMPESLRSSRYTELNGILSGVKIK